MSVDGCKRWLRSLLGEGSGKARLYIRRRRCRGIGKILDWDKNILAIVHIHIFVSRHVGSYLHRTSELLHITGTRNFSSSVASEDEQARNAIARWKSQMATPRYHFRFLLSFSLSLEE